MSAAGAVARASASARASRAPVPAAAARLRLGSRSLGAATFASASARGPRRAGAMPPIGRGRGRANRAVTSAALGLNPAAVGCLFDSPVGAILASALGGVLTSLAERLWSKRHSTPLTITHADTPSNRALLAACPHFHGDYDAVDALRNRHASTIATSLLRQNLAVEYQREVLRMRDGGHVTLDWPISVPEFEPQGSEASPASASASAASVAADSEEDSEASAASARLESTIRQLQWGSDPEFSAVGSAGADGVPGVIGVAGGGGADGCGSGGGGCDVDAAAPLAPPYRRAIPDQGRTTLRAALARRWRALPDDAPVLVLMSGIAGGSHDKYLKHFLRRAHLAGYRCVAFNCRGTSDSPLTTPQFYSASFTGDVRAVVNEIAGRWPDAQLFAVGWSLGANILTNFLGEEGEACKLSGAVAMCNPFDLNACDDALSRGFFGTVYSRSMAKNMRKLFAPHAHLFAGLPGYDRALVENSRTVRDFDEAVTRVTFGFPSVDAYYDASSSRRLIGDVRVPLLVIQAEDDPIAVREAVPRETIANMKHGNVLLVETSGGGHLGWSAGKEAPFGAPWPDIGAMQFFEAVRAGVANRAEEKKIDNEDDAPPRVGDEEKVAATEATVELAEAPASR
jgi:predicted alpha/beta-fold hydrolase